MSKGPSRHKETRWWNEEVAEAVREKKMQYGKWKKENKKEAQKEQKKGRQNAKSVISALLAMHELCKNLMQLTDMHILSK